jgi:hypothetical protein
MDTDQATKSAAARPADEELKKHGDQLERQVRDAAGEQAHGKDHEKRENEAND